MSLGDSGIGGQRAFPPTHWSHILHAHDPGSPEYERHLRRLVELYWKPVYWVIRHAWRRGHDDAKDLTQDFFADVVVGRALTGGYDPGRGSFRVFLRTALRRFMSNVVRDAARQKRGGGLRPVPLAAIEEEATAAWPQPSAPDPDQAFDEAWNLAVMEQAITALERRLAGEGKSSAFALWKRYDLDGGSATLSYADLAREASLSVAQAKNALQQVRALLRDVATEIVRGTVDGPEDLASELRSLFLR